MFLQVAALLTELKLGKVGQGYLPLCLAKKKGGGREAISVLGGMSCSSLSLEKSALEMEKYILSVSLTPAITQEEDGDRVKG